MLDFSSIDSGQSLVREFCQSLDLACVKQRSPPGPLWRTALSRTAVDVLFNFARSRAQSQVSGVVDLCSGFASVQPREGRMSTAQPQVPRTCIRLGINDLCKIELYKHTERSVDS